MNQKKTAKAVLAAFTLSAALPFSALAATDIQGHWAENVLTEWESGNLLAGYEDGTIRPDQQITRAEFVSLVNRAAKFTYNGNVLTFKDVADRDWFYEQVAIAVDKGYVGGFEDNTFRPGEGLTRGQAASILARLEKLTPNADKAKEFKDADKIPDWAAGAIGAVAEQGFMIGDPDGTFHAERILTRAEAVAALDRAGIDIVEPGGGGVAPSPDIVVPTDTPNLVPDTTVPPKDQDKIQQEIDKGVANDTLKITTEVTKDGTDAQNTPDPEKPVEPVQTAVTTVHLPDTVEVTAVELPMGDANAFEANGMQIVLDKPLVVTEEELKANGDKKDFTVADILAVVDETKSPEAVAKLNQLKELKSADEVLISCERVQNGANDGTLNWKIQAMSKEEQAKVFDMLKIKFGLPIR